MRPLGHTVRVSKNLTANTRHDGLRWWLTARQERNRRRRTDDKSLRLAGFLSPPAAAVLLVLAAGSMTGHAGRLALEERPAIYVDASLRPASCTTYSVATRACGGGRAVAFKTIGAGAGAAVPGTTVILRAGTYTEPLVPPTSGTADGRITFRGADNETVVLTGIDAPAIQIIGRQYVTVRGLTVSDVTGWGRLQDSTNIVIERMAFKQATASGTTGGLKLVRASLNRITECLFEDGTDDLLLQDASNGNVVSRNAFNTAHHSLLSIRCASANVIRENIFDNPRQKAVEIYDCEGVSDAPVRMNDTKRNLVERNAFVRTRESDRPYVYNAIQHGGQYTIVRRNVFRGALGGGVNYQQYPRESLFVNSNRLYHNTFYANRCFAIVGNHGDPKQYYDNRAVNNLLYSNHDCAGAGAQTSIDDPSAVVLGTNAVESRDPGFVDERAGKLQLAPGSRMIDRGAALTTTTRAGEGSSLPVGDILYFYDGFTLPGERGDEIQLLGTTDRARVVALDPVARTLTLNRSLTWRAGQGVSLAFNGAAPDFGAFEADANPASSSPGGEIRLPFDALRRLYSPFAGASGR